MVASHALLRQMMLKSFDCSPADFRWIPKDERWRTTTSNTILCSKIWKKVPFLYRMEIQFFWIIKISHSSTKKQIYFLICSTISPIWVHCDHRATTAAALNARKKPNLTSFIYWDHSYPSLNRFIIVAWKMPKSFLKKPKSQAKPGRVCNLERELERIIIIASWVFF